MREIYAKYAIAGFFAVLAVLLVVSGHEQSQVTAALTAACTLIVGFLFRDVAATVEKRANHQPPTDGPK